MSRIPISMPITKIVDHTPTVRELDLKCNENFKFKAGQFVMLHVPKEGEPEGQQEAKPVLRAYSVASDDRQAGNLKLLVKYVENGIASKYFWQLKSGQEVQITGPFGKVLFKEPPTEQVVFLNTGTGVAQHYSYLVSKADLNPHLRYRMLFGVRNESDIYFEPELKEFSQKLSDFQYEFVLSRPSEQWKGKKGYVQHFLDELEIDKRDTTFYLCGNSKMIKEVKHNLIEEKKFDKSKIHAEAFD